MHFFCISENMINSTFVLSEQREVIANSSAVKSLVSVLEALKNSQSPLLFYGEKGSGRCFFAKYLHKCSQNCDSVFMRLNCKTLSVDFLTELLETKPGMLHFDEIDESSAELQIFLLENIEKYSCCFSFSSEKNLEDLVDDGSFSRGFFNLISNLPVNVPPLRQRKEDIEDLSNMFLQIFSKKYNKHFTGFSDEALNLLKNSFWNGNFLEFSSCIENACFNAPPPVIEREHLRLNSLNILPVSDNLNDSDKSLKSAVDRFKKQYILQILNEVRWNQTEAAKVLGIQRTYLSRLIKELQIK